ncbi:cyclase family protein [Amycolatopsis sp. cg5]|uniref:cyclase family protein n=1 Tax=Amycolatopsis sp. cg5 TaxID=3238802 RepID=UPI003523ED92
MALVDLSSPVDAKFWEPDPVVHQVLTPADGAKHMSAEMREHLGLEFDPNVLPDAEFLNNDTFTLTVHTGTHVDAPAHYGSKTTYGDGVPRTIDQMPLDWFCRPAFVLDLRDAGTQLVGADLLRRKLDDLNYVPRPLDIALLHTGAEQWLGTPEYFGKFTGLDGPAVELLLDLGIKVIGTDAFSLDAPFPYIIERYQATGDPGVLWPAHFLGRRREYCQIERLGNLEALPPSGFRLMCFPVKLTGAGAGWARAVADVP